MVRPDHDLTPAHRGPIAPVSGFGTAHRRDGAELREQLGGTLGLLLALRDEDDSPWIGGYQLGQPVERRRLTAARPMPPHSPAPPTVAQRSELLAGAQRIEPDDIG